MKRTFFLALLLLLMIGIAGCADSDSTINEVKVQRLSGDAADFVRQTEGKSGLFLYSHIGRKPYLIVRYSSVSQGEEAKFLNDIHAEVQDRTLVVKLEEQGTRDYQDDRLKKRTWIYALGKNGTYDQIEIYRNGIAVPIDLVGG